MGGTALLAALVLSNVEPHKTSRRSAFLWQRCSRNPAKQGFKLNANRKNLAVLPERPIEFEADRQSGAWPEADWQLDGGQICARSWLGVLNQPVKIFR